MTDADGKPCLWLTLTNKGASQVNEHVLEQRFNISAEDLEQGFQGDPNAQAGRMIIREGMRIRLTQNLDKVGGFVNGAIGDVIQVLREGNEKQSPVFVLRLSYGKLVLVHAIQRGRRVFLPCTYGYATTMRRAQGLTVPRVVLWFNRDKEHNHAPDRGYAYTGASRVTSADELYHFGRIKTSDWQPVNPGDELLPTRDKGEDSQSDEETHEAELLEAQAQAGFTGLQLTPPDGDDTALKEDLACFDDLDLGGLAEPTPTEALDETRATGAGDESIALLLATCMDAPNADEAETAELDQTEPYDGTHTTGAEDEGIARILALSEDVSEALAANPDLAGLFG